MFVVDSQTEDMSRCKSDWIYIALWGSAMMSEEWLGEMMR